MKSFFKKLAFVMALAMVVSLAAPAATTASAASNLKIAYQNGSAISEVNIAKVGGTEDLKFTGAPSDWKTLGVKWSSNNEAVATVDKAGVVTAVSAGTAVIAVQVGADQATVKVNVVDLPVYTATMGTTANRNMTELTLEEVGAEFDLAFFGIKDYDKNRYNCNWYSVDENVATVDQKGLVKATGEGKTVISLGVYNVVTGKKHVVDSCTVVVGAAEPTKAPVNKDAFTVAQKDTDKFVLTFEEAKTVEQIKENLEISVKIADQDYTINFDNVAVNGKEVTVVTYTEFENDEVYTLTYGKEEVSHTIVLGDIAAVGVNYYTGKNKDNKVAYVSEEEENDYVTLVPVLYDKFGNNITAKYNLANIDFNYEISENVEPYRNFNDVFSFGKSGLATVDITATWITDNGDYKEVSGKTTFKVEKHGKIGFTFVKGSIGTDLKNSNHDDYIYAVLTGEGSKLDSFCLDPNSPVWNIWQGTTTTLTYSSTETWEGHYYTAVFKDSRGNLITSNNDDYLHGTFSYESTNNDVLSVADDGHVTVYKAGKANILVYFTPADGNNSKKLVASTAITVKPELYPVSFKVLDTVLTTASDVVDEDRDGALNDVVFRVQFYDQNGDAYIGDQDVLKDLIVVEARDSENKVSYKGDIVWGNDWADKWYKITFDGSMFNLGGNTSKQYSYKVSLEEHDVVSKVKTNYSVMNLVVKNTETECNTLRNFISSTNGGNAVGSVVPASYKFNIAFGGNTSKDVAVKHVIGYNNTWSGDLIKGVGTPDKLVQISARYQSTGGLDIANIPDYLLKDTTDQRVTTGHAGYVYYKVSAPSKTTVAGDSNVKNTAWDSFDVDGNIRFTFNTNTKIVYTYKFKLADGTVKDAVLNKDASNFSWADPNAFFVDGQCVYTNPTPGDYVRPTANDYTVGRTYYHDLPGDTRPEITLVEVVPTVVDDNLKYAAKGTYNVNFSTTRKEGGPLYSIKNSAVTVSNSQSEMKYLGLNPEYSGVTENFDFVEEGVLSADTLQSLINEQLLLSYENLNLGDYYDKVNTWDVDDNGWDLIDATGTQNYQAIKVNTAASKYTCSDDSITITKLAFDVVLDDNNTDTTYTYTTVVNVGVRIKEK